MSFENSETSSKAAFKAAVFGVGNAASSVITEWCSGEQVHVRRVVVNTDLAAMAGLEGVEKTQLGSGDQGPVGLAGEPDRARAAAEVADLEIRRICESVDIVFVVACLGRATGSGASPVVARIAHECGKIVFSIVSLPFAFEGSVRRQTADGALRQLRACSNGVITFANQKLAKASSIAEQGPANLFGCMDRMLRECWADFSRVFNPSGFLPVSLSDLCSIFSNGQIDCSLVSCGVPEGAAPDALIEELLRHPVLEDGDALSEARSVLVYLSGQSGLSLGNIDRFMERLDSYCKNVEVLLGACQDAGHDGIRACLLFSRRPPFQEMEQGQEDPGATEEFRIIEDGDHGVAHKPSSLGLSRPPVRNVAPVQASDGSGEQQTFDLPIVPRGRFANIARTIHGGEDLDIPTFVRKGIKL